MAAPNTEILLIEDERVTRTLVKKRLEDLGCTVYSECFDDDGSSSHDAVVEIARSKNIHIAICDLVLPDQEGGMSVLSGIGLVNEIRRLKKGIWIFIYSGSVDKKAAERWKKLGVAEVFAKDESQGLQELLDAVEKYSKKARRVKGDM